MELFSAWPWTPWTHWTSGGCFKSSSSRSWWCQDQLYTWRNTSPCACRSRDLPGAPELLEQHISFPAAAEIWDSFPLPAHPLRGLLVLGAAPFVKRTQKFCLSCYITVLGVAFWHFSGTHPALFKNTKIQMARQNCTVTHPWTQEKICVCQQEMNVPSYLLKEASLLNSCWWPQDKLFNVYMYLSHPDLYKSSYYRFKWMNKPWMCYPIQIIMMEHDTTITAAGGVCSALCCSQAQNMVFPMETSATKECFTIPVEIFTNHWFATNKNIWFQQSYKVFFTVVKGSELQYFPQVKCSAPCSLLLGAGYPKPREQ